MKPQSNHGQSKTQVFLRRSDRSQQRCGSRCLCAMPFEGRQEGKLDEWWGRVGRILPPKMEVSLINDIGPDGVALEIRVNHNEG